MHAHASIEKVRGCCGPLVRVNIGKFMLLARTQNGPLRQKADEEANPGCLLERYDRTPPLAMLGMWWNERRPKNAFKVRWNVRKKKDEWIITNTEDEAKVAGKIVRRKKRSLIKANILCRGMCVCMLNPRVSDSLIVQQYRARMCQC